MDSRLARFAAAAVVPVLALTLGAGCNKATPSPILVTETFTGTLQPLGLDFKTFTVKYALSATDLSVVVNSLTPLSSITIGVGFGVVSGATCAVQISNAATPIGQEQFVPSGASAGTYCIQIYDVNTVTEAVTYSMTVKHY